MVRSAYSLRRMTARHAAIALPRDELFFSDKHKDVSYEVVAAGTWSDHVDKLCV